MNTALDALTVSHIASRLDLDRGSPADWQDMEARAIQRLVAAAKKYAADNEDLEAREELALALDEVALAHAAATFEWASGPLKLRSH
jgi:hypothetical protein